MSVNCSNTSLTDTISIADSNVTGANVTLTNLTISWPIRFEQMTGLRCASCTFTTTVTLTNVDDCQIVGCTFGDSLTLTATSTLSVTNSEVIGTLYILTAGTDINLSDPSNNIAAVDIRPAPTELISYGTSGLPDVLLPTALDYAYVADPTVAPSETHSICRTQRFIPDLNAGSWYGFQFSTGHYIIEHGFDVVALLNNVRMTTPTISNLVQPNTIVFALEADLPTDAIFSALQYNDVVVKADDTGRAYVYNGNVYAATLPPYTNLWIVPHTVTAIAPASFIPVSTVSGAFSSDQYKSTAALLPPIRSEHTWYTATVEDQLAILTGPELVEAMSTQTMHHAKNGVACLAAGAHVLTPKGYRAVETLVYGDLIQTPDGRDVPIKVYSTIAPCKNGLAPWTYYQKRRGTWTRNVGSSCIEGVTTYYHIECPNVFRDNLLVDGTIVESYAGTQLTAIPTSSQRYQGYFME